MTQPRKPSSSSNDSSQLEGLAPLPSLVPPSFPKFRELVNHSTFEVAPEAVPEARPQGLFHGLLRDNYEALHRDAADNPDKYTGEARELLLQLVQKSKDVRKLTSAERSLLNRATLDFASYVSPRTVQKAPPAPARKKAERPVPPPPRPGVDVPETDMPAYWWL